MNLNASALIPNSPLDTTANLFGLPLNNEQYQYFKRLVKEVKSYDPDVKMLSQKFNSPGYHTTLHGGRVHSTFSSLGYALHLLNTNIAADRARAFEIIDKVVSLQDTKPDSKTFGLWPWFLEEPLSKMRPPDENWADFCGKRLIEIVALHRSQLPETLTQKIDSSIIYAAREIRKRNVNPSYTNIAIMGTFVTIMAGQLYHDLDMEAYGLSRLNRFYEYTNLQGGFTEYNSPTYTKVAVEELQRLLRFVSDSRARQQARQLYNRAWKDIALHYHIRSGQWSGPHSRCYATLLPDDIALFIKNSTVSPDRRVVTLDNSMYFSQVPDSIRNYILNSGTRTVIDSFKRSDPALVGTTYITPSLSIGTINQGEMWNQRRNLIAYWGTPSNPIALQLRFLHDQYDFSAAVFKSVQRDSKILAAITFRSRGGDRHPSLDKIQGGTIKASDLRIRFELSGIDVKQLNIPQPSQPDDPLKFTLEGAGIFIQVPVAVMDDNKCHWEKGGDNSHAWIDLVFYSGPEKLINIAQLKEWAAVIALQIEMNNISPVSPIISRDKQLVQSSWYGMKLNTNIKPE